MLGQGLSVADLQQPGRCQDLSIAGFSGAARTVRTKINVTFEKLSRVTGYGPCAHVVSAVYTVCLQV